MNTNVALIPLVGMAIPIIIVPVALGIRHARAVRELEHRERMKALELGRTLPMDEPWWSPSRIAVAFGVVMPVGTFFCAWMAAVSDPRHSPAPWFAATAVGLAGVLGGAVIGMRHLSHNQAASDRYAGDHRVSKPAYDADEFDVVGSRG